MTDNNTIKKLISEKDYKSVLQVALKHEQLHGKKALLLLVCDVILSLDKEKINDIMLFIKNKC